MMTTTRRGFLASGLSTGFMTALPARRLWATNSNDSINVGFVSCGGRAGQLAKQFSAVSGVNIAGLCDPDSRRVEMMKKQYPKAQTWKDLRDLIGSDSIDAVVIATCNHWHCLAAIWAMEAGKDVYVEKPLSHSQWEGDQTVAAARRYDRICQVGTQQRSDPMQAEIKKFLHEDRELGQLRAARVNRFGVRNSIGKRKSPLRIENVVDYDLWLGPAEDKPIFRNSLHYDWHWDWNTGSGEMGNWGVHVLDDVRNNVFQDQVSLPKTVFGGGGRVVWNDAGETPNMHFVYFDTGKIPVVIGLTNLPAEPNGKKTPGHPGPGSGYIVYCEGGRLEGQRGKAVAFDSNGKVIRKFEGNRGDRLHQQNFVDAVRDHNPSMLNADVEVGHHSTGWCNLANIAYRAGRQLSMDQARELDQRHWQILLDEMQAHAKAHGLTLSDEKFRLSPLLNLDVRAGTFVADSAEMANRFIKREYRQGYEVPELAEPIQR
jgi:hypothetical protein